MALSSEWRKRIDLWKNELKNQFYKPLGSIAMKTFLTREALLPQQADKKKFSPIATNTRWGKKWDYAWFKGAFTLPAETAGKRIVLKLEPGGDSLVYGNGKALGTWDREHREITLAKNARAGSSWSLLIESYHGHGHNPCGGGPVPLERESVPEAPDKAALFGENTFGIWDEEIYQLWLDVETLVQVRDNSDANSLLVDAIDTALCQFSNTVDFEEGPQTLAKTVAQARAQLKPILALKNGSCAPEFFAVGHSHIDICWLWPLRETLSKCARTFSTQLALIEQYPEFKYLQSQPHLYWMVKHKFPALYARVKQAVKQGAFIPEGGMWVEADTNVPGGESLIRQFIHGKRFFKEEFGVDNKMLWLPDVFGYSGSLPQIMRGCGINYFSTAKIFWAYHGGDKFPYNTFTWEGIDGSDVRVHLVNDYNSFTDPVTLINRFNERVQKSGVATRLIPFGFGDGGGGVTRTHLEFIRRCHDLQGVPKTKIAGPLDYFHDQEKRGWPKERYVGELYFQAHRGTLTSQARTKKFNRACEVALREAELWSVAAAARKNTPVPAAKLTDAWRTVLLNQFHDIIPGSSIHRVYEEAEAAYAAALAAAQEITGKATGALVDKKEAVTVFNSLSWPRTSLVPIPASWNGALDSEGHACPVQGSGTKKLAEVRTPACGWVTLKPAPKAASVPPSLPASPRTLENSLVRYTFNDRGEISAILDKETGRQINAGLCNSFKMYKDVPTAWDAWDLDSTYKENPVVLTEKATIAVLKSGSLQASLQVKRRLLSSTMTQEIVLRHTSRRLDFITTIDWQERHKLLKVNFGVDVHADHGVHEIQFGHLARPNHGSRPFDQDRFEVCNHKWSALMEEARGAAILNNCKYGINIDGTSMNLTLLKSPLAPDATADRGIQKFTYAFYYWNSSFAESDLVRQGYDLNIPAVVQSGAAGTQSLISVDAANVIVETVKPAEDGSGDVVLRLYECKRSAVSCKVQLDLPFKKAVVTDMLENPVKKIALVKGELKLDFKPFEIKTIRLAR